MKDNELKALQAFDIDAKTFNVDLCKISVGNSKVGKIASFSTLPTYDYIFTHYNKGGKIPQTFVFGTCDKKLCECCASSCYATKALRYYYVKKNLIINTLLLRYYKKDLFKWLVNYINKNNIKEFRYNVSGELETYDDLVGFNAIAIACPNCRFGIYTKQFEFVKHFIAENADFADNFTVNVSQWHDNLKDYQDAFNGKVNYFAYDDGVDKSLEKAVHCPAVGKNGKPTGVTCDKCNRCYTKTGKLTAVYAH